MDRRIQEIQSLSPELAKHFEDVQLLLDKNDAIIKACEQVPKSCCRFLSPSRRVRCSRVSCLAPGAVIRAVCLWLGDGSRLGRDTPSPAPLSVLYQCQRHAEAREQTNSEQRRQLLEVWLRRPHRVSLSMPRPRAARTWAPCGCVVCSVSTHWREGFTDVRGPPPPLCGLGPRRRPMCLRSAA